jgi:outer membrane protein assembly factor BamE (lipoprotein component of BamABCDE complex)
MSFDTMVCGHSKEIRTGTGRNRAKAGILSRSSFLAKLILAAGLSLSAGGCLGFDGEIVHGYQLDPRSLEQVKVGSSAEQVLVVLGYPSTTSTVGGDAWYYITQVTNKELQFMKPRIVDQHVLAIYFDKQKKVQRVANYGMKDGQVFDFVSRTTPTGGADGAFIQNMFKNFMRFG